MRKFMAVALCAVVSLSAIAFSACNEEVWRYNDYIGVENDGFDKDIFYRNDGQVIGADPSVITVGDTYYLYVTSADGTGETGSVRGYKSKNLTDWEPLGVVFVPQRDSWGVTNIWAPEVIEKDGTFYMYYSALNTAWVDAGSIEDEENGTIPKYGLGVATSSSPEGPFVNIEGEFSGQKYSHTEIPIKIAFENGVALKTIDASPFIDDDGRVYLYFSRDQYRKSSSIWGVELESDMVTVKQGTLKQLVSVSQDWERPADTSSNSWNEAPFMIKHEGKYYLTYSANAYTDFNYAVGVAVSDNPLTGFKKVKTIRFLKLIQISCMFPERGTTAFSLPRTGQNSGWRITNTLTWKRAAASGKLPSIVSSLMRKETWSCAVRPYPLSFFPPEARTGRMLRRLPLSLRRVPREHKFSQTASSVRSICVRRNTNMR